MTTYDKAMEHAKALAKETGESYFIFHQPEAWESRDTGWHVIDETEYYYGVSVIDEQTVRCSVTWDDEANDYSIEQFEPWYYSTWQEE